MKSLFFPLFAAFFVFSSCDSASSEVFCQPTSGEVTIKRAMGSVRLDYSRPVTRYLIDVSESQLSGFSGSLAFPVRSDVREYPSVGVFAATLSTEEAIELASSIVGLVMHPLVEMHVNYEQDFPTWGLDRIDQEKLPLNKKYVYPDQSGKGVHVYVIDTGIWPHNQFKDRLGEGFSSFEGTPVDCHGHGTHVAGIVGSTTYGVAKGVSLYPVRVLDCKGSGSDEDVIRGIDWVIANHRQPAVANMSLGGEASPILDKAIAKMVQAGITVVVAAGNERSDACDVSPAREPSAITVGSTTTTDTLSSFSNFGKCVDIFAPGSNIQSTYKDNRTVTMSGTSMSSPFVAGAAALLLGNDPSLTPNQVDVSLKRLSSKDVINGEVKGAPNCLLKIP